MVAWRVRRAAGRKWESQGTQEHRVGRRNGPKPAEWASSHNVACERSRGPASGREQGEPKALVANKAGAIRESCGTGNQLGKQRYSWMPPPESPDARKGRPAVLIVCPRVLAGNQGYAAAGS